MVGQATKHSLFFLLFIKLVFLSPIASWYDFGLSREFLPIIFIKEKEDI